MVVAIQIDVVVVVIDRVQKSSTFVHFVGMPIALALKGQGGFRICTVSSEWSNEW